MEQEDPNEKLRGAGLADWGENVALPWIQDQADDQDLLGFGLRAMGKIGELHSAIPGYDWIEQRLIDTGSGTAKALGFDPRIGMAVGAVLMPDVTDLVPGAALGSVGALSRKAFKRTGDVAKDAAILTQRSLERAGGLAEEVLEAGTRVGADVADSIRRSNIFSDQHVLASANGAPWAPGLSNNILEMRGGGGGSKVSKNPGGKPRKARAQKPLPHHEDLDMDLIRTPYSSKVDAPLSYELNSELNRMLDDQDAAYNDAVMHYQHITNQINGVTPMEMSLDSLKHRRDAAVRKARDIHSTPVQGSVEKFINNWEKGYKAIGDRSLEGTFDKAWNKLERWANQGIEQHHSFPNVEGSYFTTMLDDLGRAMKVDAWGYIAEQYKHAPGYSKANMWNIPKSLHQKELGGIHVWLKDMGFEDWWQRTYKESKLSNKPLSRNEIMDHIDLYFEDVYYPSIIKMALMIQEAPAQYSWRGLSLPEEILKDAVKAQKRLSNSMFSTSQLDTAATYSNKAKRRVTRKRKVVETTKQLQKLGTKQERFNKN